MKIYMVGGALRDELLGLPVQDRDYVVVGATPDDMLARGFRPVGKDFPVFLHPVTHEEHALARTERKTAPGYRGFVFHAAPDVTLEQDLARRDLTINAMAKAEDGSIIDPFGGQRDLRDRIFRHVSPAFAEDPVRILRVARFAARFTDFTVAAETRALMRQMVQAGEVDALVPERVWQELARGLMEDRPSRMFGVLRECGALARIVPELDALWEEPQRQEPHSQNDRGTQAMAVIDRAARQAHGLPVRCAVLMHDLDRSGVPEQPRGAGLTDAVCRRLKVPNECRDLAVMTAREHANVAQSPRLPAEHAVSLLERCDALRKPQRFIDMLRACECIHRAGTDLASTPFAAATRLETALDAARAVDAGSVAQQHRDQPQRIAQAVHAARVQAVRAAIGNGDGGDEGAG